MTSPKEKCCQYPGCEKNIWKRFANAKYCDEHAEVRRTESIKAYRIRLKETKRNDNERKMSYL